jgi:hypothetical protein
MTRRLGVVLVVLLVALVLSFAAKPGAPPASPVPAATPGPAGVGLQARTANRPIGGDAAQIAAIPSIRLARVAVDTPTYAAPGGRPLVDGQGNPIIANAGMQVAVFEGPQSVGADLWFRVELIANANSGPADYFAWLPFHDQHNAETIAFLDPPACPDGDGISVLGALDPFTRAGCVGAPSLTLTGWTWDRRLPTWYQIAPAWLGNQNGVVDSTISISNRGPRDDQGAAAFGFLDLQLPPGLERPPFEFQVQATVHVADPAGATCVRTPGESALVPLDDPRDGHLWCTTRMVIEQWTPLLGPEGRPIDPGNPQLHRHAAGNGACAGVGMGPLVLRIDPSQLDPVWLQPAGAASQFRIIPNFGPGFRLVFTPELVLLDARGQVVAKDGTPVNPDGNLAGHLICPTGSAVFFD